MGLTVYLKIMKQYQVVIEGVTPYMQHRMDDAKLDQWEKLRGPIHERPDVSIEDATRAEYHCYRNQQDTCYIPSEHVRGSLIAAGSFVKAKVGGRSKSMKQIVAAMFMVSPFDLVLPEYDSIDKRSAVNRNVKARVIVIRPKWNRWSVVFTLSIDEDSITIDTVTQIIEYAGKYVGIGSFRPANNGMFGRFKLLSIDKI